MRVQLIPVFGAVFGAVVGALVACGAPTTPAESVTVDLAPRPSAGVRYEIRHRETRQIDDAPPTELEMRVVLEVGTARPGGSRSARARLIRGPSESDTADALRDEVVTFELSALGLIVGEPSQRCGAIDGLRVRRYLQHLLGARAFVANGVGEGSEWRGTYYPDLVEVAPTARFHLDAVEPERARGRFVSRSQVDEAQVGATRVSGEAHVRARFSVSLRDGFAGRTQLLTDLRGRLRDDAGERPGRVQIRSDVVVRRVPEHEAMTLSCDFAPAQVTEVIGAHIGEFQACYEHLLAEVPSATGRLQLRFSVQPSGRFSDGHVSENTLESASLAQCMVDVLARLRVRNPPRDGPVRFAYPFVFSPSR